MNRDDRPKGRETVLSWTLDYGDPLAIREVLDDVHRWICDGMPGDSIHVIHYDGHTLKITLR